MLRLTRSQRRRRFLRASCSILPCHVHMVIARHADKADSSEPLRRGLYHAGRPPRRLMFRSRVHSAVSREPCRLRTSDPFVNVENSTDGVVHARAEPDDALFEVARPVIVWLVRHRLEFQDQTMIIRPGKQPFPNREQKTVPPPSRGFHRDSQYVKLTKTVRPSVLTRSGVLATAGTLSFHHIHRIRQEPVPLTGQHRASGALPL